ncbi:VOC family protein [Thalassospira sp.]|uniref:VOC family protein n=1 Tax=Thalassospira sp. TaxID=1912094 RepID=UPI00273579DD|nr:VOC family protein [Thalassospira sp.]MDP2697514.1 VOC family protein [Thalassospira sp.]
MRETTNGSLPGGVIIPALQYDDVATAIDFLCRAFGFERHAVYETEDGIINHAQLVFGNGMIMLGQAQKPGSETGFGKFTCRPRDAGGVTQSLYIVVPDADNHYARAIAASAEIILPIRDEDYGGRGYSARDPEGHVWTFGTYDPYRP